MRPSIGRIVHYFPRDERKPELAGPAEVWPAIITAVADRDFDKETGEEVGPWVVSLTAFRPCSRAGTGLTSLALDFHAVPLAGMYDREDLDAHPEWIGCWNWPRGAWLEA